MKIDTQGMSYGTGKGTGKSIEEQRAALPDVEPKKINIITDRNNLITYIFSLCPMCVKIL